MRAATWPRSSATAFTAPALSRVAVVASEVKALAGQTAKATEDIGAQISGMQHATMRAIEAIGAIERTIREIGDISGAIAAARKRLETV